jgi:hypothetical protein
VDAVPALELLESSLFGQGKRVPRTKKPRAITANAAEEECIKKIDQAREMTVPNSRFEETTTTNQDPLKTKKASGGRIKGKKDL